MTDRVIYPTFPEPDGDLIVQLNTPADVDLVSHDAAMTRFRFRKRVSDTTGDGDPVPVGADWFIFGGQVPTASVKTYTGGSLASFLSSLKAGDIGVLDFDGTVRENINLALADKVSVYPVKGKRTWLDGSLRISGGEGVKVFGLNVRWTNADPGGHMVKLDGGSIEFAYAELAHAACYTLLRPGQALHDSRLHHLWVHDNPGVASHNGAQDHGVYASAENPDQNLTIDHCLIEGMPRGRNVKVGGPSAGPAIGGITVSKCTLRLGHGPSNGQVSNGATDVDFTDLVLIDSGASTSLTEGSGAGPDNIYTGCWSDKKTGPNSANLKDLGGNVVKADLSDYVANGKAGKGHLAP